MSKKQCKTASLAASPSKRNNSLSVFVNYVHKKYKSTGKESPKSLRTNNRVKVTYGKSTKGNRNLTSILNAYPQDSNFLGKTADSEDSGMKLLSSDDDEEYQSALDNVNNDNKERNQSDEKQEESDDDDSDSDYKEEQSEENYGSEEDKSDEDEDEKFEDNKSITNKLRLKENGNKDLKSINQEILKLQQEQEESLQLSKQEKAANENNEEKPLPETETANKKSMTNHVNQEENGSNTKVNSNGIHTVKSINNNKDYLYGQNPKYSDSDFYQIEESPKDFGSSETTHKIIKNWTPQYTSSKPCGLLNHGVTCYTNAAVQAMIHIPAVQHYLDAINNGKVPEVRKDSVSSVFAQTSKKMWYVNNHNNNNKVKYINPKRLIKELDNINCMMSVWQQEDSHEYFMSLLSRLQEDSTPKGKKLNSSIIYDIFGGLLEQEIQCQNCQNVSTTMQEFYDLSLSLDPRKKREVSLNDFNNSSEDDLQQDSSNNESTEKSSNNNSSKKNAKYSVINAIKDFFEPELIKKISKSTGYECSNCNKISNALKLTSIEKAPETLTIHIKRFRFDENSNHSSKLKSKVSFPCVLDLPDFKAHKQPEEKDPIRYQLIAVVVHEGRSVSSGHYIAHCRQPNGEWNTYDDEYVNKISEVDVLNETNAYYLVYTRLKFKQKSNNKKRSLPSDKSLASKKRK